MTDQPKQPQPPIPGKGQPPAPSQTPGSAATYTDGFGIASIILAVFAFSLPGFIVGLIGASKAKRVGASPVLSRIGWIVNLIMLIFTLAIMSFFIWLVLAHPHEIKSYLQSHSQTRSAEMHY